MMPRHPAALALVAALALGACSDVSDPSTVESPTPSTGAGSTPSATPSVVATIPTTVPSPAALPTDLADGKHYAYLKKFDRTKLELTVDVVQFLTGEAAEKAAQEDGEEAFDYYVRNQNPKLRTLTFTAGMKVVTNTLTASESGSSSKDVTITHAKLASFMAKGEAQQRVFWFTLDGGAVVRLQEQYLP